MTERSCRPATSRNVGLDIDRTEAIVRAFLDGEGDDEALLAGIVLAGRRNDLDVGIAVLEIKPADQVAVGLDTVGIVDVGRLQEAQPIGLCRS